MRYARRAMSSVVGGTTAFALLFRGEDFALVVVDLVSRFALPDEVAFGAFALEVGLVAEPAFDAGDEVLLVAGFLLFDGACFPVSAVVESVFALRLRVDLGAVAFAAFDFGAVDLFDLALEAEDELVWSDSSFPECRFSVSSDMWIAAGLRFQYGSK